ncbi:MAG: alcohol dehydrogenase catalytic domain-containing protein [Streptosporangiales bacterium]|nr:alcohol dehydrogenase catalytic domain-containing protein [Streptosporangiales bacterium]
MSSSTHRMPAAVFHGRGDVRVEEVAVPRPGPNEVLLSVAAAGICGTDAAEYAHGPSMFPVERRHPATGHLGPMVMGHEFAGTVVAVGDELDPGLVGRLVASAGSLCCGACWQCARGRGNMCESYAAVGLHRDGALARYVTTPLANCVFADEHGLTGDAAALVQPMSIAVHAARRSRITPEERAVLVGAGGIGAFLVYVLGRWGVGVAVRELVDERLELARRLGAAPLEEEGGPPAVVFEVSGTVAGYESALATLPRGGRLVLVGIQKRPHPVDLGRLTVSELEFVGTNAMVYQDDLPEAVRLVAARREGWADVAPTALTLDELVPHGLEPLTQGRAPAVKMLVDPWANASRPTAFARRKESHGT